MSAGARARATARARAAALAIALAATGAPACGPPHVADPTAIAADDAIVKVTSSVPDAALWVDGRYIGVVGALRGGFAIHAGTHRVELRHDDYLSRYAEITLTARERRTLTLSLAPRLP